MAPAIERERLARILANKPPGSSNKATQQPQQPPADAQPPKQQEAEAPLAAEAAVILELLQSLGYTGYDAKVVNMLMDLTYRNTAATLRDAEAIAIAAGGTGAELSPHDIALAVTQQARMHPQPPSLNQLHALARQVNAQPLAGPSEKQHGIKLPPVADCLLSQNFQVRPRERQPAPRHIRAAPAGPPRQHLAVRQPGPAQKKLGMAIPQQWQPAPDAAGEKAEPFAPAAYPQQAQQRQQAQQGQQQHQGETAAMDVDQEQI